jgi:hypothetical protein
MSILGVFERGDYVYYVAASFTPAVGYRFEYGAHGEVLGAIGRKVAVQFRGNPGPLGCLVSQLSRSPAPPLSGNLKVDDEVFYCGGDEITRNGDRLVYGGRGTVVGPSATSLERVLLRFPGNAGTVGCLLDQLTRTWPPPLLPGDFEVGDEVCAACLCALTCSDHAWGRLPVAVVHRHRHDMRSPHAGALLRGDDDVASRRAETPRRVRRVRPASGRTRTLLPPRASPADQEITLRTSLQVRPRGGAELLRRRPRAARVGALRRDRRWERRADRLPGRAALPQA